MPTTPNSAEIRSASSCASADSASLKPGAGAITSVQIPLVCTVRTIGYETACPCGERATWAASSWSNGTKASASQTAPADSSRLMTSSTSTASCATHTPLPS